MLKNQRTRIVVMIYYDICTNQNNLACTHYYQSTSDQ